MTTKNDVLNMEVNSTDIWISFAINLGDKFDAQEFDDEVGDGWAWSIGSVRLPDDMWDEDDFDLLVGQLQEAYRKATTRLVAKLTGQRTSS